MKKFKILFSMTILLLIGFLVSYTLAELLENDVEVEPSSQLTYYLNVKYDGIDVVGRTSSDEVTSEVHSGIIYVEDKIPEGLEFDGFVTTEDGIIGAVERNNSEVTCNGRVIDDTNESGNAGVWNNNNTEYTYHGLHYDANTRTVSFKVSNLKAGCILTVGIKTITPGSVDDSNTAVVETRRDFYNYGTVSENLLSSFSNMVHVYMGSKNATLYTVTYEYENGTSNLAPALPPTMSYAAGSTVGILPNVQFDGYSFQGWTSNDVTIENGKFTMPSNNVVIKGSFQQASSHKVTYTIDGTSPTGYVLPFEKNYYPNALVYLDSLKEGDTFNGYKFLGWESEDVDISYDSFEMPNNDVAVVGRFIPVTYDVTYQFIGNDMPDNYENLLPLKQHYSEGDIVTLSSVSDVSGYKFLGWFQEDGFTMPNHNITVMGEWKRFSGYFEPTITMETLNSKPYYRLGDKINYKITVTNTANYPIQNVIVKSNNGATFVANNNYIIQNNLATIGEISAGGSVYIFAEYTVTNQDSNSVTNEVELRSAIADNDYELKNKNYKVSVVSNLQSKLKLCADISGVDVGNSFRIKVFNNTNEYSSVLKDNECMTLYVDPGTYTVREIVPQEYNLQSVTGSISSNNQSLTVLQGENYQINFVNKFKSKKFMHSFGDVINTVEGGQ